MKAGEVRGQCGGEFDEGEDDDVDHQDGLTSEPFRERPENQGTDRPHDQGEGDGQSGGDNADPEFLGQICQHKDQHKIVERIQRPAAGTGKQRVALGGSPGFLGLVCCRCCGHCTPPFEHPAFRRMRPRPVAVHTALFPQRRLPESRVTPIVTFPACFGGCQGRQPVDSALFCHELGRCLGPQGEPVLGAVGGLVPAFQRAATAESPVGAQRRGEGVAVGRRSITVTAATLAWSIASAKTLPPPRTQTSSPPGLNWASTSASSRESTTTAPSRLRRAGPACLPGDDDVGAVRAAAGTCPGRIPRSCGP